MALLCLYGRRVLLMYGTRGVVMEWVLEYGRWGRVLACRFVILLVLLGPILPSAHWLFCCGYPSDLLLTYPLIWQPDKSQTPA